MTMEIVDTVGGREYEFKIDAYTPDTLPMARLAEYMADLARLLGEAADVHFVRLDEGSAKLIHRIEGVAVPKVRERVKRAHRGDGPVEAVRAIQGINKLLREDNGTGVLVESHGAEIIRFPGREEAQEDFFVTMTEEGSLDGTVVRLGGLQEWVPVHLEESPGRVHTVLSKRAMAKALATHLWTSRVRVHGEGTWLRSYGGKWTLNRFYALRFDILDDVPLGELVAELREIKGSEWQGYPDPWAELKRIRHGEP